MSQCTEQKGTGAIGAYAYDAAGSMAHRGGYTNTWDSEG